MLNDDQMVRPCNISLCFCLGVGVYLDVWVYVAIRVCQFLLVFVGFVYPFA